MRVAVSYDNGNIFKHVGDTKEFKIYEIADGDIISTQVIESIGKGRGMVVNFLVQHSCDILICNEICSGAKEAVQEKGVQVFGGVLGDVDEAINMLLRHELNDGSTVICNHE